MKAERAKQIRLLNIQKSHKKCLFRALYEREDFLKSENLVDSTSIRTKPALKLQSRTGYGGYQRAPTRHGYGCPKSSRKFSRKWKKAFYLKQYIALSQF
jgi:hypothetical protein